ncbi:MAG: hypothetical protein HZB26_19245 [Candidatus Hydrogenedentes bacterium]|nr:hypothetical protein [Candidatus Hydrogenedentota bacterium]
MNENERVFGEVMTKLLQLASLPYYEAKPRLEEIRAQFNIPTPWELPIWKREPGWYAISTVVHERFGSRAYTEATIDLTRFAILLEKSRSQDGDYPAGLDALAPAFGGHLPVNPFDGMPYQYARTDDGYDLSYKKTISGGSEGREEEIIRTYAWPGKSGPTGQSVEE